MSIKKGNPKYILFFFLHFPNFKILESRSQLFFIILVNRYDLFITICVVNYFNDIFIYHYQILLILFIVLLLNGRLYCRSDSRFPKPWLAFSFCFAKSKIASPSTLICCILLSEPPIHMQSSLQWKRKKN